MEETVHILSIEDQAIGVISETEIALVTPQGEDVTIPILKTASADERQWCKHAIAGERPETCDMFATDEHTLGGFCKLNGYSIEVWGLEAALAMRTPCVFDEPEDAPIWAKVERWRTQESPLDRANPEQISSESG